MRNTISWGAAALITIIAADPAFCLQASQPPGEANQPHPADPSAPVVPPVDDPSQPTPPITEPLPPEMPLVAGNRQANPPVLSALPAPTVVNLNAPIGPLATAPGTDTARAVSGGTMRSMMMPQPTRKTYPLCTRTLQDNCRNPGEGAKKP